MNSVSLIACGYLQLLSQGKLVICIKVLMPLAPHLKEGLITVPLVSLQLVEIRLRNSQPSGRSKSYLAIPCFLRHLITGGGHSSEKYLFPKLFLSCCVFNCMGMSYTSPWEKTPPRHQHPMAKQGENTLRRSKMCFM